MNDSEGNKATLLRTSNAATSRAGLSLRASNFSHARTELRRFKLNRNCLGLNLQERGFLEVTRLHCMVVQVIMIRQSGLRRHAVAGRVYDRRIPKFGAW